MSSSGLFLSVLVILVGLTVAGLLLTGAVLIIRDTIRKRGRWGIPLEAVSCARCGDPVPLVRMPASVRQALWGGWTCPRCGLENDKWGRPADGMPIPPTATEHYRRGKSVASTANPDIQKPALDIRNPDTDIQRG
jgi:hypothetical protein